jgi:phosphate:Na+ symporter
LQRDHRAATLSIVESGKPTIVGAFAGIDATWRLDQSAHHAWRSAVHPLGAGADDSLNR